MTQLKSEIAETCPEVAQKALKKALSTEARESSRRGQIVELEFQADGGKLSEATAILFKNLVKGACGSGEGTTKVGSVDVKVDTEKDLPAVPFSKAVRVHGFDFNELPADSPAITAVAEATYIRFLVKHADPQAHVVTDFPKCLAPCGGLRMDTVVGGHVLFSLRSTEGSGMRLILYQKAVDIVLGVMCTSSFAGSVLPKSWGRMEELQPSEITDMLEDAQLAISDFWSDSEQDGQARSQTMFLMTTVGTGVREYFAKQTASAGGVLTCDKGVVDVALSCCDEWIHMCKKLTTIDWGSAWRTNYEDPQLKAVRDRLQVVVSIRDLAEEIVDLLTAADQLQSFRKEHLWESLESIDIFKTTPAVEQQWSAFLSTFYRRLQPVEHRCAKALRDFFGDRSSMAPQIILNEVVKYRQLIRRPVVAKELVSERDNLLAKLNERLYSIRMEFEHRSESVEDDAVLEEDDRKCQTGRFMPGVVNNLIWLRQLRGKTNEMVAMCKSLLNDLQNADDFVSTAKVLLEEISDYELEIFKHWTMNVEDCSDKLTLDANAPLMEIDDKGQMEVNYPERLVQLIREVRIFESLGFRVSRGIHNIVNQGVRFYRNGVSLKQVASTYNSMNDSIIPSTRAMLLESALSFERVITASGDRKLTWRNKEDAERFIAKLRHASQSLTDDNRRLHKLHREIEAIVIELFSIDLLRQRERWTGKVRTIREKMEMSGFKNMEAWKLFWDVQLYKALEHQYQLGLESLHELSRK
ncbi:putative Dynein heavy chain N terminal region 2 domain1 [Trypanosoma vivax]|nr:putative Dynein heavy chain N terminal region 2 domain1 [Trypanosoma vivax]